MQKYKYWHAVIALVKTPRAPFVFYSLLALFCFLFITLTSPSVEVIALNAPIMRAHITLCTHYSLSICVFSMRAHILYASTLSEHTLLSAYICLLWPRQHMSAYVSIRQHASAYVSIYHSAKRAHITLCLYLSFLAFFLVSGVSTKKKKSISPSLLRAGPWETENAVEEQESAV